MAARIRAMATHQLGESLARYLAPVVDAVERGVQGDQSVYLVRKAERRGSIASGLLALTSSRCILATRGIFRKRVHVIDMPFNHIAKVAVEKRSDTYLVVRLLLTSRPPVEIRLGRRVPDRERVAQLLANLASDE